MFIEGEVPTQGVQANRKRELDARFENRGMQSENRLKDSSMEIEDSGRRSQRKRDRDD
jgi:hypothetical protein